MGSTHSRGKGNTVIDYIMGGREELEGMRVDSNHHPVMAIIRGQEEGEGGKIGGKKTWRGI